MSRNRVVYSGVNGARSVNVIRMQRDKSVVFMAIGDDTRTGEALVSNNKRTKRGAMHTAMVYLLTPSF